MITKRSYYSKPLNQFLVDEPRNILGELTKNHEFNLEEQQKNAWIRQIDILKEQLRDFNSGHIIFEYSIPRMGRRVDIIFIYSGIVFVLEFKVGGDEYPKYAVDQALDYAIDLKNFQEGSHTIQLVPILVATKAPEKNNVYEKYQDGIFQPLLCNAHNINSVMNHIASRYKAAAINPLEWETSLYKPTPTIIEAAQALYHGHSVKEISRSDSGAINLSKTAEAINKIIKEFNPEKIILFGSYAYGKPTMDSDIDLMIVMDTDEKPHKRAVLIRKALKDIGIPKDIIVKTPQEFERFKDIVGTVIYPVAHKGKLLYERR